MGEQMLSNNGEHMGDSLLLRGHVPRLPPKVYAYGYLSSACLTSA